MCVIAEMLCTACRQYYEQKKAFNEKIEKTLASNARAMKAAEAKTSNQLSQAITVANIQQIRKTHWFEKFNWFISSEGYLVLSGRDPQQNELLVKRYVHGIIFNLSQCSLFRQRRH